MDCSYDRRYTQYQRGHYYKLTAISKVKKTAVFKIISVLLPLVLIVLLEIVLRIIGYGETYNLFNKTKGENGIEYLTLNSHISKKYFKNTGFNSDNQSDLFLSQKTDSTFRIFVQGASTTVGFPFYRGASFPRLLKQRLEKTFPEKNIEVINTGITAVNSYTLWDITPEIIAQKPDLVLIYAGHNEYYGALGVGSSASVGNHPFLIRSYLKLKNFKFFQLLENTFQKITQRDQNNLKTVKETTLMEVLAKEQQIPFGSKAYLAGLQQYEQNLGRILSYYKKHNIPVILSTLVSNEKDTAPFISPSLNIEYYKKLCEKDLSTAKTKAQHNAMASYVLGHYFFKKNQLDTAKHYFHQAKELDLLRFRAPEAINTVIRQFSKEENIPLVDIKALFESKSPSKTVGKSLLTEHVHPNVEGYFLMADAFYTKLEKLRLIGDWKNKINYPQAFSNLPTTKIDSIRGTIILKELQQQWPFTLNTPKPDANNSILYRPTSFEERMAWNIHQGKQKWEDAMRQAYHFYTKKGDFKNALTVVETLLFEYPEQWRVHKMAEETCLRLSDTLTANYYANKKTKLKAMKPN